MSQGKVETHASCLAILVLGQQARPWKRGVENLVRGKVRDDD